MRPRRRSRFARIGMRRTSHWRSTTTERDCKEAALKAGSAFFTTKTGGHGLGLFLANATIERMGGSVRLFNRKEGGATTLLTLPAAGRGHESTLGRSGLVAAG